MILHFFFVRPFPIHEEDKPLMDRYMAKIVSLGILSKNNTTHTSPVMLVGRSKGRKSCVEKTFPQLRPHRQN